MSSAGSLREALNPADLGSAKHREAALQTAEESITLLKNNTTANGAPLLPLGNQPLFVFGSAADDLNLLNGAWTNTWQGNDSQYSHNPLYPTIWEALVKNRATGEIEPRATKGLQYFAQALSSNTRTAKQLKTLKKSLTPNAVAIFCIGETPGTEIPGNIDDLNAEINAGDKQLFDFFVQNQVPVVLVLATGRPRIITEYANKSTAVLQAYLPGNEGGTAIAKIIYGATNPSGKLPYTYPRFAGDVVHYDHKSTEKNDKLFGTNAYQPLFDFGSGLSYTQFEYSKMKVEVKSTGFNIEVTVTNTGSKPGKEGCQLYYRDDFASITPSVKKLCAYHKTKVLQPGESETISMYVSNQDLSFVNKDLQRVTEPGDFTFMVKDQKVLVTIQNEPRTTSIR
jgi:beta-glucosidase